MGSSLYNLDLVCGKVVLLKCQCMSECFDIAFSAEILSHLVKFNVKVSKRMNLITRHKFLLGHSRVKL